LTPVRSFRDGLALAVRRAHPPALTGRAAAALAADPHAIARTSHALNVTDIAMEHGIPGEDRPVSCRLLHICEFGDGRISRENVWMDLAAVLGQLGAIPARP
jgi:predicted ester cyclase